MSSSSQQAMDVDGAPNNGPPGTLKRSSSAPMINEAAGSVMSASSSTPSSSREPPNLTLNFGRTRRYSTSSSLTMPGSPISGIRLTPNNRINQIRQEEYDVATNSRELAHERKVYNDMQMSQSLEDLPFQLMAESQGDHRHNRMTPIHVSLPSNSFGNCSSPSPTRSGFQSPSRSRSFIRRSESPVLRPSPLGGVKRKLDEKDDNLHLSPRTKRVYSYSGNNLLTTTTSNSLPGSLSSVGTPESLSSADSPGSGYTFRNVDSPSPTQNTVAGEPMIVGKTDHDMAESPS